MSGLKSRVLKLQFFNLKMIMKNGLDIFLKSNEPLQRYLLRCLANSAFLGRFFCSGQQLLWRGLVNFKIRNSRHIRDMYMIYFKNVDCKTRDFSPLIKKVLAGVEILCWQNVKKIKIDTRNVCHQKLWSFFERKNGKNEEGRTDITTTNVYSF